MMLPTPPSARAALRRRFAPKEFDAHAGDYDAIQAPPSALISSDGNYPAGWYTEAPAQLELDRNQGAGWRRLHRWFFLHFDSEDWFVGANLVDLRLGGNTGIIVLNKRTGTFRVAGDTGILWRNGVHISNDCRLFGDRRTGSFIRISPDDRRLEFDLQVDGVTLKGRASALFATPFVQSTCLGGALGTLQTWGNLTLDEGEISFDGQHIRLEPGLYGAYDRSLGHRRLVENWNWIATCGDAVRDSDGAVVPFALHAAVDRAGARPRVNGRKFALWVGDRLVKLPDVAFDYRYVDPDALKTTDWHIASPRHTDDSAWLDLAFTPSFHRRDKHHLPLLFNVDHSQYFGAVNGQLALDGETYAIQNVFATAEESMMLV